VKKYDTLIIAAILIAIFLFFFSKQCSALDYWEISDYQGFGGHHGVDYWQNTLTLKGEKYVFDRFYLGGQADITRYNFGCRVGLGGLFGFDLVKSSSSGLTFYAEGNGGFALATGYQTLDERHTNLLKSGPYGIFGAEIGIRIPIGTKRWSETFQYDWGKLTVNYAKSIQLNIGLGYDHMSSLKSGDKGLNTFGPKIGIRW